MGAGSWFQENVSRPARRTMGLPVQSDVPAPPEPIDVDEAARKQAEANRFNISGPFGGIRWTQNADGTWTQYQTPNAAQQNAFNALTRMAPPDANAYRTQGVAVPTAAQQSGMSFSGPKAPTSAYAVNAPSTPQWNGSSAGRVPTGSLAMGGIPNAPQLGQVSQWKQPSLGALPTAPQSQGLMPLAPTMHQRMPQVYAPDDAMPKTVAAGGPQAFRSTVNQPITPFAGMPGSVPNAPQAGSMPFAPGAGQVAQFRPQAQSGEDAQRATFERAMAMFQPQFQQQQRRLDQQLANQGLPMGSEAFAERQSNLAEGQSRAMTDAALAAVLAGNDESARRSQIEMAQYQNTLAGQGQQFGQNMGAYQAALAGQGQQFGQQMGAFDAALRGRGQQFGEQLAGYDANLRGRGQQFGEDLSAYDANLRGRGQQFSEQMGAFDTGMRARGQEFAENLGVFDSAMRARGQEYAEKMGAFDSTLRARGQLFGEQMGAYDAALRGRGQLFGEQLSGYNAQLAGQGQAANQALAQYNSQLAGQAQRFGQSLSASDLALRSQAQQFGQDISEYDARLTGQGQSFGHQMARAAQMFGQDLSAAQFGRESDLMSWNAQNQANQQNFGNAMQQAQMLFGNQLAANGQNFGQSLQANEAQRALSAQLLGYMPGIQQVPIDVLGPMQNNFAAQLQMNQAAQNRHTQQTTGMWGAIGSAVGM